jgi:hypothetical protein
MQMHKGERERQQPVRVNPANRCLDPSDPFGADLLNGLHALAQPLSVLRAASEVLTMPRIGGVDQRHYIETWCAQVERACTLFGSVQNLVATRLIEADRARFDLWELLAPMIDDQRAQLHSTGVGFAVANTVEWAPVLGDAERTAHALAAVLRMAGATASKGDVIELQAFSHPGFMQLRFQNSRRHGRKMNSSDRLSLSLAAANITSQHGTYDFREDPFCFSLALPLDDHGSAQNRMASSADRTH